MNNSILAIFLASMLSCVYAVIYEFEGTKKRSFFILLYLTCLSLLILFSSLLQGRAAFVGGFVGLTLPLIRTFIVGKRIRIFTFVAVVLLCSIFSAAFFKKNSTSGRLLIYKVTFSQLRPKDYFTGIGLGGFKAHYNQYQAAYFEKNNIDSKEALLAGNGYYLFNDLLQFVIEIGLFKLLCLTLLMIWLLRFFYWSPSNPLFAVVAGNTLPCLLVASLFSYPLQVYSTGMLFTILLFCYFWFGWSCKNRSTYPIFSKYRNIGLFVFIALMAIYSGSLLIFKHKSSQAFELYKAGFKVEADAIYSSLETLPFKDYNINYNRAFSYYMSNQLDNALNQIDKSLNIAYSVESIKLKADILVELNRIGEAEHFYRKVVFITPGRMLAREALFNFYIKTKNFRQAKYWGESILKMPIKIQSDRVSKILADVRMKMNEIIEMEKSRI
jgi:O-antigen polymerase